MGYLLSHIALARAGSEAEAGRIAAEIEAENEPAAAFAAEAVGPVVWLPWDGSKEGWSSSDAGDARREKFKGLCEAADLCWIECETSGDDGQESAEASARVPAPKCAFVVADGMSISAQERSGNSFWNDTPDFGELAAEAVSRLPRAWASSSGARTNGADSLLVWLDEPTAEEVRILRALAQGKMGHPNAACGWVLALGDGERLIKLDGRQGLEAEEHGADWAAGFLARMEEAEIETASAPGAKRLRAPI